MKSTIYSWVVSATALGAGMLCVLGVWHLMPGGDPQADQNRERFAALSSQEQSDLRNKAAAFIGSANQPELTRLQTIHAAVEENPQLLTRLRFLDDFLPSIDPETQASLAPNGEFADDWAEKVQQLANDESVTDEKFRFPLQAFGVFKYRSSRSRSIEVNGAVYEQFLDQIVGGDWDVSPEFQEFINGDDRTLRRLFKGLSVARRLTSESPGEFTDRAFNLARQLLLPDELRKSSERMAESISRSRGDDQQSEGPDRMKKFQRDAAAIGGLTVVDAGLWNSHRSFLKQYDARETLSPEDFTQHFKRAEQLNLMAMDPEDAAQEVTARLVREKNVSDPVIAKVAELLAETRKLIDGRKDELRRQIFPGRWSESGRDEGRRGPGRSGERGPDDRGPGDRNPAGRGPGPGGRGPGDRGLGGRDGGGGRGPDGREFGGRDRGPGGPPRNQNEDRDPR